MSGEPWIWAMALYHRECDNCGFSGETEGEMSDGIILWTCPICERTYEEGEY